MVQRVEKLKEMDHTLEPRREKGQKRFLHNRKKMRNRENRILKNKNTSREDSYEPTKYSKYEMSNIHDLVVVVDDDDGLRILEKISVESGRRIEKE